MQRVAVRARELLVGALLVLLAPPSLAVEVITPQELADRIRHGNSPFVLDVRTPEEFAEGHVPGAVNIPITDLAYRAREILPYRTSEIVVYCAVGPRAYIVGRLMEQNGFTGVLDLQGHMQEWSARGYPIQKSQ